MKRIEDYLEYINGCYDTGLLAEKSIKYLKENLNLQNLIVIKHKNHPKPFEIIERSDESFDFDSWQDDFLKIKSSLNQVVNF